jgi:endonuclease/exonuclease/phosphatase family metal-dependent hydrolase
MRVIRPATVVLEPRADAASLRVLTWNVHCGRDAGPPWMRFGWPRRKLALADALRAAQADILCVQEALPEQVAYIERVLPHHDRAGVGRDGGGGGEHCAIFFLRDRFTAEGGDTFWLKEPTDVPGGRSLLRLKRICTWVRLRDRSGRSLRVYNTHSYLTERPRRRAARLVRDRILAGDPADAVILCGDFNAPPGAASRRIFTAAGLTDSAALAGRPAHPPTFHWRGIPLRALDAILVSPAWHVRRHVVVDVKPSDTWPSDHFGVMADLAFHDN